MTVKKDDRATALEELRQQLLQERQRLVEHMMRIENDSDTGVLDVSGDSADLASVEISQSSLSRLGGREQKLLQKIDHALKKFELGTYGVCELTGEDIPVERLKARPVAQYTIEAKEMLERKERQYSEEEDTDNDVLDLD